jgi:hypothetical protein
MNLPMLLTTLGVVMLLLFVWLVVQRSWQVSFPERSGADPLSDPLSGQFSCGNCACTTTCERTSVEDQGPGAEPFSRSSAEPPKSARTKEARA